MSKHWDLIRPARNALELDKISQFRYAVYVEEMGRIQHDADQVFKRISDKLDHGGINIAAFAGEDVVGVVRVNFPATSPIGDYEDLYQLKKLGADHPRKTAIVTRLMIAPHLRRSTLAVRLCAECYLLGLDEGIKWCFIDCNDHLVEFFSGLGFREYIGKVRHEEYGMVTPMRLELNDLSHLNRIKSPFAACLASRVGRTRSSAEFSKLAQGVHTQ